MTYYERIPPVVDCASPDGHDYCDVFTFGRSVPRLILCTRCGAPWGIAVFEDDL